MMKYLKLFEQYKSLEEFYTNKINWKLIEFIEYILTEYEDIGFSYALCVKFGTPCIWSKSNKFKSYFSKKYNIEELKTKIKLGGITYEISLYHNTDEEERLAIMNIRKKIENRFNISVVYFTNGGFGFKLKDKI